MKSKLKKGKFEMAFYGKCYAVITGVVLFLLCKYSCVGACIRSLYTFAKGFSAYTHLQRAFLLIKIVTCSCNFNCVVCSIEVFVFCCVSYVHCMSCSKLP